MKPTRRVITSKALAGVALAGASFGLASVVHAADEPPTFRNGMWEFTRTIQEAGGERKSFATKRCAVPSVAPKKGGPGVHEECKFSPMTKNGNAYHFTVDCKFGEKSVRSTSVITAESDSAYQIDVDLEVAGQKSKEQLSARRIGDC